MKFFTAKLLVNYLLILSLGALGFGTLFVLNENKLQRKIASERLHEYRDYTSRFFQQEWVLNALEVSATHSVEREAKLFSDPHTKCQRFFLQGEIVGGFGKCKATKDSLTSLKEGWQKCSHGNLVLMESFHDDDLSVITVLNNPHGYSIENGNILVQINEKNLRYAIPNFMLSLVLLTFAFLIWNILIYFRKQRDSSLDRIHDFSKASLNLKHLALKLKRVKTLDQTKQLANILDSVASLQLVGLEELGVKNNIQSHNLKSLIDRFLSGFFYERNHEGLFDLGEIDPKIYIKVDESNFLTVLLNLCSNAYESIHGIPHAKLKLDVICGAEEIQFLLSNNCSTSENLKASIEQRKGRGLNIVSKILNGKLSLFQTEKDNLLASFSAPIDWEATCPELY